jgi:hypothetical protein
MEKLTNKNVIEKIEDTLKSFKIRFNQRTYSDDYGANYELFIGSASGYIQAEFDLTDDTDDVVYFQFYSKSDSSDISLYHYQISSDNSQFDLEYHIEELIENIKKLNSILNKIEAKIDQIRSICEENELDMDDFIEVVYDFE